LEKKELVHRDLAARNCLISKYGRIKVADFGLSKLVSQLANESWQKQQVPVRWMSPETLKRNPEYSSKSDVWAFGILTWEVFSYGEKPWPDWENKKIATFIRRGQMMPMPGYTPTQMKSLVSKMWALKPSERPDFAEILKEINKIQLSYPPPKPEKCSVIRIKGVIVPPPNFNIDEEEQIDDIQIAAAAYSLTPSKELPQPSIQGNNPVEHNTAEEHEKIPEKKKKKIYRTGCCILDFILNKGRHKNNEEKMPHTDPPAAPSSPVEKKKKSNKQAASSDVKSVDGNVEMDKKSDMTPSTEQKAGTPALKKK
jgi:serine/threonine protein kinase